jgi:hypothetical protein
VDAIKAAFPDCFVEDKVSYNCVSGLPDTGQSSGDGDCFLYSKNQTIQKLCHLKKD